MSIIEAFSLVAGLGLAAAGLIMSAMLLKDEFIKIHNELRYMNSKTNRLLQLSQLTLEPVDLVKGEPIVLGEITKDVWDEVFNILSISAEERGAAND